MCYSSEFFFAQIFFSGRDKVVTFSIHHLSHNFQGLGLIGSKRKGCTRQARLLRRPQARLAGSNGRTHRREKPRHGHECTEMWRRAKGQATASSKDGRSSTARCAATRLGSEARREAEVCELVQLNASGERPVARWQGRRLAQGVEVARRDAQSDLGAGRSGQGWKFGRT